MGIDFFLEINYLPAPPILWIWTSEQPKKIDSLFHSLRNTEPQRTLFFSSSFIVDRRRPQQHQHDLVAIVLNFFLHFSRIVVVVVVRKKIIQMDHPFFTMLFLLKVKYLRGAFRRSRSLKWPDYPCPLEPGFGIMPLSSALSQLHILCVARLLPIPEIIHLRCAH